MICDLYGFIESLCGGPHALHSPLGLQIHYSHLWSHATQGQGEAVAEEGLAGSTILSAPSLSQGGSLSGREGHKASNAASRCSPTNRRSLVRDFQTALVSDSHFWMYSLNLTTKHLLELAFES